MSEKLPPRLYPVPPGAAVTRCKCGKLQVFGVTDSGARCPLSIDSEWAARDEKGRVVSAPSHFTDCTDAARFSRHRPKKKPEGG